MSQFSHKNQPMQKAELSRTAFEAKRPARIGSKKSPAKVIVPTEERKQALESIFNENKWTYEITVDAEQEENILDLEFLQNKSPSLVVEKTPSRNDPCSCGSGKKYKKCCG
ncbi:MAG: zinc chelation protein SecC [Chloroflexota bacterium]|nr:MAG: zinc chelation protein SecC [Chloroflexota bacterium]